MFPLRKDTIPNQYSTIIITQQYPILPTLLEKLPTGNKPFIDDTKFSNKKENKHNDYTIIHIWEIYGKYRMRSWIFRTKNNLTSIKIKTEMSTFALPTHVIFLRLYTG